MQSIEFELTKSQIEISFFQFLAHIFELTKSADVTFSNFHYCYFSLILWERYKKVLQPIIIVQIRRYTIFMSCKLEIR